MKIKENLRKIKGITLVALVITIIVLIMLAGISINFVLGENGIVKKAEYAKQYSKNKEELEKIQLATYSALIEGNGEIKRDILEKELKQTGFEVTTKNLTGVGPYYFTNDTVYEIGNKGEVTYSNKKTTIKAASFEGKTFNELSVLSIEEELILEKVEIDNNQLKLTGDLRRWSSDICNKY